MTTSFSFPGAAWKRTIARLCLASFLVGLCAIARAGDPQINSIAPWGVQRGSEATFTITGTGLTSAKEILFYTPGFTVKDLVADKDETLKATVAVAPDCQLGIHAIR